MNIQHPSLRRLREDWWRSQGERPLVTTFWPQDYQQRTTHTINGRRYHVTRYVRAADPRFFEVWGRPLDRAVTRGREYRLHPAK